MISLKKRDYKFLLLIIILIFNSCKKEVVTTTILYNNVTINQDINFEKYLGAANLNDRANAAIFNSNNNVVIIGEQQPANGEKEVFLVEMNREGEKLWQRTIKVGTNDIGNELLETNDGYLVVGQTAEQLGADILILKVNKQGDKQWVKSYKSPQYEWAIDVVAIDNDFFVLCTAEDSVAVGRDMLLLKIDQQGELLWSKKYGGASDDAGWSMIKDRNENILLAGHTYSYGFGNRDAWLIKIDQGGNEIWNKTYGGAGYDECMGLVELHTGGYLFIGHSASIHPEHHLYAVHITQDGNILWEKHLGGIKHDGGENTWQDQDGNILLLGRSNSFDSFKEQAYFLKLDIGGNLMSEQHFVGQGECRGDVILEDEQSYWLIGTTIDTSTNLSNVWVKKISKK